MPKIIISGLTAAGKTTHSRLIADGLGIPYISGSALLTELVGKPGPWTPELDRLRANGSLDRELDRLMIERFQHSKDGVFDAWALPWLSDGYATRVWIESNPESRLRKAMVTELRKGLHPTIEATKRIIEEKDNFSRDLFMRLYGFDLFGEREIFDFTIDNSGFIPKASIEDSDRGIREFQIVLMNGIAARL
jgi:cytidylate kinase